MLWWLIGVPVVCALLCLLLRWNRPRRVLLVVAAALHSLLSLFAVTHAPPAQLYGWIALDAAGSLFLIITSGIFLVAACYAVGYLARESAPLRGAEASEAPFANYSEAVFTACLLFFLASMTLVVVSRHWGLLWVAVEGTTLASAPLIYFHRHARSLEATWKYLMICSVGIALALLGNFFLAVAVRESALGGLHLSMSGLEEQARTLNPLWLRAAFLLILVGYGTKMGLVPLHTWKPDAYSEAPSMVSALLSGVLSNCAFLALLRAHSLMVRAGLGDFSRELFVMFGLISMAVASIFLIQQLDYKRLLAYSSVEHMGILVLGAGIGGAAGYGGMLHALNHSLAKSMLFLAAGNTLALFRTKSTLAARGAIRLQPVTGVLWVLGMLAITGSPPFGTFLSELMVLKGVLDGGRSLVGAVYLAAICIAFIGISAVILPLVYGNSQAFAGQESPHANEQGPAERSRESWWALAPPLVLAVVAVVLGVYLPPPLAQLLHDAASAVGVE